MQLCFLVSICKLVIGAQIIDEYLDIRSLRYANIRSLKTSIRCSPKINYIGHNHSVYGFISAAFGGGNVPVPALQRHEVA